MENTSRVHQVSITAMDRRCTYCEWISRTVDPSSYLSRDATPAMSRPFLSTLQCGVGALLPWAWQLCHVESVAIQVSSVKSMGGKSWVGFGPNPSWGCLMSGCRRWLLWDRIGLINTTWKKGGSALLPQCVCVAYTQNITVFVWLGFHSYVYFLKSSNSVGFAFTTL